MLFISLRDIKKGGYQMKNFVINENNINNITSPAIRGLVKNCINTDTCTINTLDYDKYTHSKTSECIWVSGGL